MPENSLMPRMKPRLPGLLLALVLLGHWAGLSWLREQVQDFKPLVTMPDPMFTRVIEPVRVAALVRPPRSRPRRAPVPPKTAPIQASPDQPGELPQPDVMAERPLEPEQPRPEERAAEVSAPVPAEATPAPDSWPVDTRLSYDLTGYYRGDMYGSARVQWQREQSRYQVQLDLSMALVIRVSMISQGAVTDTGLVPSTYEEQFPGGVRRIAFDGGYVKFHDGTQLPQPQALQDTASQFVELSHRFSSGRDVLQVGGQVLVWLARPQGMALWTYDVIEEETLQIPAFGPVQAFHLRPRPIANPKGVITAEMWFAPSLQYLPVRVRISLGAGNFADLMVERIEQGAAPVAGPPDNATLP